MKREVDENVDDDDADADEDVDDADVDDVDVDVADVDDIMQIPLTRAPVALLKKNCCEESAVSKPNQVLIQIYGQFADFGGS